MTYCFSFLVCFCLIIVQTTVLPHLRLLDKFYDLLAIFVLYLGFFRSIRESIPIILFFGFIMDGLSGGPSGLYITAYFWLLVYVRWLIRYLQIGNIFLVSFVAVTGIFIQNLIFFSVFIISGSEFKYPEYIIKAVFSQVLWSMFTGPFFLLFFNYAHKKWEKFILKFNPR